MYLIYVLVYLCIRLYVQHLPSPQSCRWGVHPPVAMLPALERRVDCRPHLTTVSRGQRGPFVGRRVHRRLRQRAGLPWPPQPHHPLADVPRLPVRHRHGRCPRNGPLVRAVAHGLFAHSSVSVSGVSGEFWVPNRGKSNLSFVAEGTVPPRWTMRTRNMYRRHKTLVHSFSSEYEEGVRKVSRYPHPWQTQCNTQECLPEHGRKKQFNF